VYVDDVAQAALLADETPGAAGEVYNITDGANTTLRQFVGFHCRLSAAAAAREAAPGSGREGCDRRAWRRSHVRNARRRLRSLNKSRLRFLYYNQRYSIEKARSELGYEPHFRLPDGAPPSRSMRSRGSPRLPFVLSVDEAEVLRDD